MSQNYKARFKKILEKKNHWFHKFFIEAHPWETTWLAIFCYQVILYESNIGSWRCKDIESVPVPNKPMTCPSIVRNGRIFYRFASCYVHTIHPKCPFPEFDAERDLILCGNAFFCEINQTRPQFHVIRFKTGNRITKRNCSIGNYLRWPFWTPLRVSRKNFRQQSKKQHDDEKLCLQKCRKL